MRLTLAATRQLWAPNTITIANPHRVHSDSGFQSGARSAGCERVARARISASRLRTVSFWSRGRNLLYVDRGTVQLRALAAIDGTQSRDTHWIPGRIHKRLYEASSRYGL